MTIRLPKALLIAIALIVLGGGVGVSAFLAGRSTADIDGALARGKAAGVKEGVKEGLATGQSRGERAGRLAAEAEYLPGRPAYERIFRRGEREGRSEGRRSGYRAGAADAFSGFDAGWEVGRWYIVHFSQPTGDQKYNINRRLDMETGESYNICPDDAERICGGPL